MKLNPKFILTTTAIACAITTLSIASQANELESAFTDSKIQAVEGCIGEEMISPFIQLDEMAMINQITGNDHAKAQQYLSQIKQIESDTNQDFSVEQETTLLTLENRLADLIEKHNIKCVKQDMLATLSRENKLRALEIWHELEVKMAFTPEDELETTSGIESLLSELDSIMAKVN